MEREGTVAEDPRCFVYHHVVPSSVRPSWLREIALKSKWNADTRVLRIYITNGTDYICWGFCETGYSVARTQCKDNVAAVLKRLVWMGDTFCSVHRYYCNTGPTAVRCPDTGRWIPPCRPYRPPASPAPGAHQAIGRVFGRGRELSRTLRESLVLQSPQRVRELTEALLAEFGKDRAIGPHLRAALYAESPDVLMCCLCPVFETAEVLAAAREWVRVRTVPDPGKS